MKKISLCLLLMVTLLLPGAVEGASPAAALPDPSGDSSVTVSGKGDFANLKIAVSQTKNLINQTVKISWTGGAPSVGSINFLQIMQCWGDGSDGPERTQCEFGALPGAGPGNVARRNVAPSAPGETLAPDPHDQRATAVPFWPVGGQQPTTLVFGSNNDYFDAQITNEVPVATTRRDGTGQVFFETQTVRQSAGLGCGQPVDVNGATAGRRCWLVIVPRGTKEADGTPASGNGLTSSPFDPRNWDKKITVPLDFLPQGQPCPLGAPERQLTGHELAVDAVSLWQPALCANGGALYSLSQLTDDLVRSQLLEGSDPGMGLLSNPIPPDQQRPDRPLVYAPIAASGLAIAFNISVEPGFIREGDPRQDAVGQPFTEMKLTPRLVAKLLTQSYTGSVVDGPARFKSNPLGLTSDPEFLDLNPEYRDLLVPTVYVDTLVQAGTSDLTGLLWDWVLADPDARAFVNGTPDPSGMVVNDANKGLQLPLQVYPRNDQTSCITARSPVGKTGPFCTGDAHQFANDMHAAGRAASRGDPLGLDGTSATVTGDQLTFPKKPRQGLYSRALIAVVDAVTAQRYQLPTAKLRNAKGEFVAPDGAGLLAGLDAMKPSPVQDVLQPDPATSNAAAYPLTSLSYAATSPPALTKDAGRDYAAFIRYAIGPGQQTGQLPGQLPFGYVPLPERLRQQALAAATIIETQAGISPGSNTPPPDTPPKNSDAVGQTQTSTPNGAGTSGNQSGSTTGNGTGASSTSGTTSGTSPASVPSPGPAPAYVAPVGAQARPLTPAQRAWAVGALLITLLIGGGLAAGLAPVTHRLGTARKESGGGDTSNQTGARKYLSWPPVWPTFLARRR